MGRWVGAGAERIRSRTFDPAEESDPQIRVVDGRASHVFFSEGGEGLSAHGSDAREGGVGRVEDGEVVEVLQRFLVAAEGHERLRASEPALSQWKPHERQGRVVGGWDAD